jgi:hypothetical protein
MRAHKTRTHWRPKDKEGSRIESHLIMSRENLTFICTGLAGVIVLFTLGLFRPFLIVEDGLVENLSAAGFAAASLLALATALQK